MRSIRCYLSCHPQSSQLQLRFRHVCIAVELVQDGHQISWLAWGKEILTLLLQLCKAYAEGMVLLCHLEDQQSLRAGREASHRKVDFNPVQSEASGRVTGLLRNLWTLRDCGNRPEAFKQFFVEPAPGVNRDSHHCHWVRALPTTESTHCYCHIVGN